MYEFIMDIFTSFLYLPFFLILVCLCVVFDSIILPASKEK